MSVRGQQIRGGNNNRPENEKSGVVDSIKDLLEFSSALY